MVNVYYIDTYRTGGKSCQKNVNVVNAAHVNVKVAAKSIIYMLLLIYNQLNN